MLLLRAEIGVTAGAGGVHARARLPHLVFHLQRVRLLQVAQLPFPKKTRALMHRPPSTSWPYSALPPLCVRSHMCDHIQSLRLLSVALPLLSSLSTSFHTGRCHRSVFDSLLTSTTVLPIHSMYPLLKREGLSLQYAAVMTLFVLASWRSVANELAALPKYSTQAKAAVCALRGNGKWPMLQGLAKRRTVDETIKPTFTLHPFSWRGGGGGGGGGGVGGGRGRKKGGGAPPTPPPNN